MTQPRQHIRKQRHYFANKGPSSESYGFSSSHVWIWELEYKESWALKNWYFQLWCWRRLLKVPWTARRLNQSILKEISPEYSLEGLMLKLKLPILWPLDAKNWLTRKDPDAGKDWRREEKGTMAKYWEEGIQHNATIGLSIVLGTRDEDRVLTPRKLIFHWQRNRQ